MEITIQAYPGPLRHYHPNRKIIPLKRTYHIDLENRTVRWQKKDGSWQTETLRFEAFPQPKHRDFLDRMTPEKRMEARRHGVADVQDMLPPSATDFPSCASINGVDQPSDPGDPDYSHLLVDVPPDPDVAGDYLTKHSAREIHTEDALRIRATEEAMQGEWILKEAERLRTQGRS